MSRAFLGYENLSNRYSRKISMCSEFLSSIMCSQSDMIILEASEFLSIIFHSLRLYDTSFYVRSYRATRLLILLI